MKKKNPASNECISNRHDLAQGEKFKSLFLVIEAGFEPEFLEKIPQIAKYEAAQKHLYETENLKKIEMFLKNNCFMNSIQRLIVLDENFLVAKLFLQNWNFEVSVQESLAKKSTSRFIGFVLARKQVSEASQLALLKRTEMKKILYRYHKKWRLCKKAENICNSVLKIKI